MLYTLSVVLVVLALFVPMSLVSVIFSKEDFDSLISVDQ
jgi:hypothetical protein